MKSVDELLYQIHRENDILEFVLISLQVFTIGLILFLGLRKDKKIKRS